MKKNAFLAPWGLFVRFVLASIVLVSSSATYGREVFLEAFTIYQAVQITQPYVRLYDDPYEAWAVYSASINSPSFTGIFTVGNFLPGNNYVNGKISGYTWTNYSGYYAGGSTPSGSVSLVYFCPAEAPMASNYFVTSPGHYLITCVLTVSDREADTSSTCTTCFPVQITSGMKFLRESDYVGATGLAYVRTYRAAKRGFTSIVNAEMQDNSVVGKSFGQCHSLPNPVSSPPKYIAGNQYCFRIVANGAQEYRLINSDGYTIHFSGDPTNTSKPPNFNETSARTTDAQGNTSWRVRLANDVEESYDNEGQLRSRTTRSGAVTTFTKSDATTPADIAPGPNLLLSQTGPFGHTLQWRYNAARQMIKMIDPAGGEYDYSYDANRNLTGVVYPADQFGIRRSRIYHYEDLTNKTALTGITDENGWRHSTYTYDNGNKVSQTKLHANVGQDAYTTTFAYAAGSSIVTDGLGTSRTYNYGNILNYDKVSDIAQPCAPGTCTGTQSELRTYDVNGNVAAMTDRKGNRTDYIYDLSRNLEISRTEGLTAADTTTTATRTITTTWHPTFRLPATVNEPLGSGGAGGSRFTTNTYDAFGNLSQRQVTTPTGSRTWRYTYDAFGRVLSTTDPRNNTTTNTYFPNDPAQGTNRGMLASVTNAAGHTTTITSYNAHGQPLSITDANGLTTTMGYDPRQRLTSRTVGTETTIYEYDGVGQLTKVTLPDNAYLRYTYDGAHRLVEIKDGLNNRVVYTLDNIGNRIKEEYADPANVLTRTRSRAYDALNRLQRDIGGVAGQVTQFAYDANGNQTDTTDPLSRTTTQSYDALNRLLQVIDPVNGSAAPTKYEYDNQDNLTKVTDPKNLSTTYVYNGFNELTSQVSPDTGTTSFTYDAVGNMLTRTDARGVTATYSYDALNRVNTISYPAYGGDAAETVTYSYDTCSNGKGRLCSITDKTGTTSYSYDNRGRILAKSQTTLAFTQTVGYGYNGAGMAFACIYDIGSLGSIRHWINTRRIR